MGKVIKTKDGRTLMKGPDGRWMSAGGKATQSKKNKEFSQEMFEKNLQRRAAEKTVKLKNISDTANMIEKYNLKSAKYNKDEDSYTISQSDYDKMYESAKNKKYIENLKHGGGQMYTHGYLPNPTKKTIRDATKIAKLKNQYKLSDEAVEELMKNHGGNVDRMEKSLVSAQKIVDKHGLKRPATQLKKAINTINNAGPMTVSTAQRRDSLSNASKSKSLSFEKREGYGLNPAEYKLSNGDGISPRSLNPNEGNPTNIKKLKDIPGRTSRHTDEIIVKSNYGDKEYVVTREHYKDTKTGYHRAEVVDVQQHTSSKKASIANLKAANADVKRAAQDEAFKQHGISRDQVINALKARGLDTASAERQASSMAVADAKKLVKQKVSTAIGTPAKIAIDVNGEKIKPRSASSGGFYSRGEYDLSNHKLSQSEIDDLIDKMGMTDITWQRPGVGIKGTNTAGNTRDGDELQLGIKFLASNGKKALSNIRVWKRDGKYTIPGYTGKGSYDSQEEAILAAKKYLKSDYRSWWNNGYMN